MSKELSKPKNKKPKRLKLPPPDFIAMTEEEVNRNRVTAYRLIFP